MVETLCQRDRYLLQKSQRMWIRRTGSVETAEGGGAEVKGSGW